MVDGGGLDKMALTYRDIIIVSPCRHMSVSEFMREWRWGKSSAMPKLIDQLDLERCPHCSVNMPSLVRRGPELDTVNFDGRISRFWRNYVCSRCGGVVTAASRVQQGEVDEMYPRKDPISEDIPERARHYLSRAIESIHVPEGSIVLSASAVDAMLKALKYKKGSLYSRIGKAAKRHLITPEMAEWAHDIRLEANDQRHVDENAPLPNDDDARRCVDFALSLADFLFVLPARVKRGRGEPH